MDKRWNSSKTEKECDKNYSSESDDEEFLEKGIKSIIGGKCNLLTVDPLSKSKETAIDSLKASQGNTPNNGKNNCLTGDIRQLVYDSIAKSKENQEQKSKCCQRRVPKDVENGSIDEEEPSQGCFMRMQKEKEKYDVKTENFGKKEEKMPMFKFTATDTASVYLEITLTKEADGSYAWNDSNNDENDINDSQDIVISNQ